MLWFTYLTLTLLLLVGTLLIFVVLLQRGRGGGLAGALGGMGGQSAFGTKAGDLFTRITVVLAIIWIVLCAGQIPMLRAVSSNRFQPGTETVPTIEAKDIPGEKSPLTPPAGNGATDPFNTEGDTKSKDETPADTTGEKPATETPAAEKPTETKADPAAEKPEEKPADEPKPEGDAKPETPPEKPAEDKPAEEKPPEEKPAEPKSEAGSNE